MAKVVKMADMDLSISMMVFRELNKGQVKIETRRCGRVIVTDVEPKDLTYPEGWYYAKGCFRNKRTTSTGVYHEMEMETSDGRDWSNLAKYCTLTE